MHGRQVNQEPKTRFTAWGRSPARPHSLSHIFVSWL